MKVTEIKTEKVTKFEPIILQVSLESLEEARLMFHVLGHPDLVGAISSFGDYRLGVSRNFNGGGAYQFVVKDAIKDRGYNI